MFNRSFLGRKSISLALIAMFHGSDSLASACRGANVDALFKDLAEGRSSREETERLLKGYPRDEAVSNLVRMLSVSFVKERADLRELAYSALVYHNANEFPEGRNQLIVCLGDPAPTIQRICCEALDRAFLTRELAGVQEKLNSSATGEDEKRQLITRLVGWGACAADAYDTVKAIFLSESSSEDLQWSAARAMLAMRGLSTVIEDFQNLNPTRAKVVMWSLARFLVICFNQSETNAAFG